MTRGKTKATVGLAALLAVAATTTAVALPDGHSATQKRAEQHRQAQAKALGGKLGISAGRVEKAMDQVRADRREKHQDQRAAGIASRLGVPASKVERGLEKGAATRRAATEKKDRRGAIVDAVAEQTGKSKNEVRSAMKATAKARLEQKLKEARADGTITDKRADRIQKRIDSGHLGPKTGRSLR